MNILADDKNSATLAETNESMRFIVLSVLREARDMELEILAALESMSAADGADCALHSLLSARLNCHAVICDTSRLQRYINDLNNWAKTAKAAIERAIEARKVEE